MSDRSVPLGMGLYVTRCETGVMLHRMSGTGDPFSEPPFSEPGFSRPTGPWIYLSQENLDSLLVFRFTRFEVMRQKEEDLEKVQQIARDRETVDRQRPVSPHSGTAVVEEFAASGQREVDYPFVQIAAWGESVYALDGCGQVWVLGIKMAVADGTVGTWWTQSWRRLPCAREELSHVEQAGKVDGEAL